MATASATISRRYGPLPLWAWAGLAVVAFLLYRHLHVGSSPLGALTAAPADPNASPVTAGDNSGGGGSATSGGSGMTNPADPTAIAPEPPTSDAGQASSTFTAYTPPPAAPAPASPYAPYYPAAPTSTYGAGGAYSTGPGTPNPGGGITGRGIQGGL